MVIARRQIRGNTILPTWTLAVWSQYIALYVSGRCHAEKSPRSSTCHDVCFVPQEILLQSGSHNWQDLWLQHTFWKHVARRGTKTQPWFYRSSQRSASRYIPLQELHYYLYCCACNMKMEVTLWIAFILCILFYLLFYFIYLTDLRPSGLLFHSTSTKQLLQCWPMCDPRAACPVCLPHQKLSHMWTNVDYVAEENILLFNWITFLSIKCYTPDILFKNIF